ncbi:peptide chain release factor N(5)-glutamine methyltransferase [Chloroflexota bacterium]
MTIKQALSRGREILAANNVEDTALESELLLRHALEIDRVKLYANLDYEVSPEQEKIFWRLIKRRLKGEPTAYITGHREFYGIDFYVDPRVLIPRPESELLVEKTLDVAQNNVLSTMAEIGTGCGAIAISLALNLPQAIIYATDISASALEVALINCQKHGASNRIRLLQGDMLAPLPQPVDLIIANLPYVRETDLIPKGQTNYEPLLALNGGADGLEKIRQLCHEISGKLGPGGRLLIEIGQAQRKAVTALLQSLSPSAIIELLPDLSGIERVLSVTFPATIVKNHGVFTHA